MNLPLKQSATQISKGSLWSGNLLNLHFLTGSVGQTNQLGRCIAGFFKSKQSGTHTVTIQGNCDIGRLSDQQFQNRHMLAGKVRKSIYVKDMVSGKIMLLHLFQQQCFLITGVTLTGSTNSIIGFQNQGQLMDFLRKSTLSSL